MWAQIINEEIVEKTLPRNFKNVSNFNLLPDEEKKTYGWYKIQDNVPVLEEWQTKTANPLKLENNEVIRTYIVNDKKLSDYKSEKIKQLYSLVEMNTLDKYPIRKQVNALANRYTEQENLEINTYIDTVKADMDTFEQTILDAANYETVKSLYDLKYNEYFPEVV